MDALRALLDDLRQHGLDQGHTRGLFHLLIGRRLLRADGTLLAGGLTWRQLAVLLKKARWNKEAVRELGLQPQDLPPRDRLQYWYTAISAAHIDSLEARRDGDALATLLVPLGYRVAG
jgi:hypothetical protein